MATYVDQGYFGWSQELPNGDEHQEMSISKMLDHGSISFGRFAPESLSWERRSVFTHDSRQEELEKFNGLVAKKKAYFEERYRRMRALKAALQQQGQQTELILEYGHDYCSNSSQSGEEEDDNFQKHEKEENNHTSIEEEEEEVEEVEEVEPVFEHDFSFNKAMLSKDFYQEPIFQDVNSLVGSFDMQLQVSETEPSPMRGNMEEKELSYTTALDSEVVVNKQENLESTYKHDIASCGSMLDIECSNDNGMQHKKSHDNKSLPKIKESASRVINIQMMKQELKLDIVRPLRREKYTPKQMVKDAESSQAKKTNLNRADKNTRSTIAASNKALREARFNVDTQRSNAIAVERRASIRGTKTSMVAKTEASMVARLPSKSSLFANAGLHAQDTLKAKGATSEVKKALGSENRRVSKETEKRPSSSDNRTSKNRIEPPHLPRLAPKLRSFNLPAKSMHGYANGIQAQSTTIAGTRQEKGRENIRLRDSQGVDKRIIAPSTPRTRTAPKVQPSLLPDAVVVRNTRKHRVDNLSLDGSKTRQEAPKWR